MTAGFFFFFGLFLLLMILEKSFRRGWRKPLAATKLSLPATSPAAAQPVLSILVPPPSASSIPRVPPKPEAARNPPRQGSRCEGDRFWVPAGGTTTVAGREIPGMVYVGSGLRPVSDYRGSVEPALLDPHRKVIWTQPDHAGSLIGYWPSYSAIDPASRAAYLHWLASGRKDPAAAIGYVFLFFYGIERRVLVDARISEQARAEIDGLLAEVERLLGIYGNRSFRAYASSFLAIARLLHRPVDPATLQPPRGRDSWEIPLSLKIGLGALVVEGKPIPPEWAYAWMVCSPEIRLRTPAQRCPEEFEELFKIRYAEAFTGEGLKIRPNKTFIKAEYHPASPSFSGSVSLTLSTLPDVTALTAPVRRLQEIVDRTVQDLDVYSRWVGRTGDVHGPAALALLPPQLARGRQTEEGRRLVGWIEERLTGGDSALVEAADLLERWPGQTGAKLARRDAEMLALFLARHGVGLEPDVRFGGPPPGSGKAVLFRLAAEGDAEPEPAYQAATVLLHLAVAVSAADGEISAGEERHLFAHLEGALALSPAGRTRLKAHLRWLMACPPGLAGLKKKIEPLAEPQRREIGQFLITVAGADGHVDAEELKLLARIYPLLGLEAQAVYSDVHALASTEALPAAEPVTVLPAGPGPSGFPIPRAPRADGVRLDPRKIQAKLAESEDVAGLLEGIFASEEEPARAAGPRPAATAEPSGPPPIAGLDAIHSALLRRLAEKGAWERVEVERLAADFGLLPDGALEVINEAAFERCGAPLLEGDETLEVDGQVLEEILA